MTELEKHQEREIELFKIAIQSLVNERDRLKDKLKIAVGAIKHKHWWVTGDPLRTDCDGCIALNKISETDIGRFDDT